jgi:NAD(P)-dependent dehydrogenase (short-subunit alcohol dehydrogenase family)
MNVISSGKFTSKTLQGRVVVVTGAGRGIGLEAARSLCWLGAKVVIVEIDPITGKASESHINKEFGANSALFVQTDVGDEKSIAQMAKIAINKYDKVDIVLNNATIFPMGAVVDVPIEKWDSSYRVNFRGVVLLARAFLPAMIKRKQGVFVCVSSVGDAFMSAYESFKAAQVHLANTLSTELENTGVYSFTIGPGIVKTPGAEKGIAEVAKLMGKTSEDIFAMNKSHILTPEAAGAGFAASIAMAERYQGQEISSIQVLMDAGLDTGENKPAANAPQLSKKDVSELLPLCRKAYKDLSDQNKGFQERSLFEKQWVMRDFRKTAGLPVEEWLGKLEELSKKLESGKMDAINLTVPLSRLSGYYRHMEAMAKGYEKDPIKLKESLEYLDQISKTVETLSSKLSA